MAEFKDAMQNYGPVRFTEADRVPEPHPKSQPQ